MGVAGLIVAATDWSDNTRRAAQRAACIGTHRGVRGSLVHISRHGWTERLHGAERLDTVRSSLRRLEKLAQDIYEKTGFVFDTKVHSGDASTSVARIWNAGPGSLVTIGESSDAWFGNGVARRLLRKASGPVLVVKREPDTPYRRILVAVDCSDSSAACIEQARAIAPEADLVVVYALDPALEHVHYARVPEEQHRIVRMQRHEDALDRLNSLLAGAGVPPHQVVKIVEHAYAPRLILNTEREFHIDLLIVGRSSASLLRRCFFRGVAAQVLAQSGCDVLVVPAMCGVPTADDAGRASCG